MKLLKYLKPKPDVLKLDGSRPMTGNLKMGDHTITGIRSSSVDNAALTVGASKSLYLPISGIRGMQGNLNMGGQSIVNLRPFVELTLHNQLKIIKLLTMVIFIHKEVI